MTTVLINEQMPDDRSGFTEAVREFIDMLNKMSPENIKTMILIVEHHEDDENGNNTDVGAIGAIGDVMSLMTATTHKMAQQYQKYVPKGEQND